MTRHDPIDGGEPLLQAGATRPLHIKVAATASSMDYFATRLRPFIDRPISNQTGLPGAYDFELTFTMQPPASMMEGMSHNGTMIDFSGPSIFKAVSQQLGLRLEPGRAEIQTIVVERAEPPIAN